MLFRVIEASQNDIDILRIAGMLRGALWTLRRATEILHGAANTLGRATDASINTEHGFYICFKDMVNDL